MDRALLICSFILLLTQSADADDRRGPRLRIGRAEFGVPFLDSFVTVHGDRATVKVFSRGDFTNVHTQSGTQVDVGIRSLFVPRDSEHFRRMPADTQLTPQAENNFDSSRPMRSAQVQTPPLAPPSSQSPTQEGPAGRGPVLRVPAAKPSRQVGESDLKASLRSARQAIAGREFQNAEKLASHILQRDTDNHAAYSIRAAARIGQGEKNRDQQLIRKGLEDILQAITLGKQNGDENERDYIVWFIGLNELASLSSDGKWAASAARTVDEFTTRHVEKFPDELKEQVYHEQGCARLLLGKRAAASESFRNAAKFRDRTANR